MRDLQNKMYQLMEAGDAGGATAAYKEIKGLAEREGKRLQELLNVGMLKYKQTESRR